jgi:hypothetical protein
LYIVRIDKSDELRESGPCIDCLSIITELGIKRIVYSSGHNEISAINPKYYTTRHHTLGRRFLDDDRSDEETGYNKTNYTNNKEQRCKSYKSYSKPTRH